MEALKNPNQIEKIFVKNETASDGVKELIRLARQLKVPCHVVPSDRLNKIVGHRNHQGALAMVAPVAYTEFEPLMEQLLEQEKVLKLFVLDGITDVRNLGAIARTAAFMGFDALIVGSKGSAALNNDAVKSSAGALLSLPICRVHVLKHALFYLQQAGIWIVGASEKAQTQLWDATLNQSIAIVMGSEDEGISNASLSMCNDLVAIPGTGAVQSLNVSVAAAMIAYEVVKQQKRV